MLIVTPADPIAAYLSSLEHERRLSAHTLRGYTHELDELQKLANGRPLESLTATDIRGAVARAHAGGLTARSIAHRLSAWRAFYRWLAGRVADAAEGAIGRRYAQAHGSAGRR
jgi:integrase/recombinase XerC